MSLKNYLNQWFNEDYFKLLIKRHLSLAIIPLVIFFGLLFLFAILDFDVDGLAIFVIPYAVAIVPLTALILFKPYTKKGDTAYLTSIPLTRNQLFVTTFLVGWVLIEFTLFSMTTICFVDYMRELVRAVIAFQLLGTIYYTFACLGCMIGGHTIAQFLNMGVICFAPVTLYLISKLSMGNLSFGNYSTPINDSLVMVICPLLSAAEFLAENGWPYWWAHLLLVIGMFSLCLYLMNHRPIEQTGHGSLFETVEKWIIKPLVYLNVAYLLFNICWFAIFSVSHYYNQRYYLSILLLLMCVSLLVGVLIAIWTSKDLKSLLQPKEMLYQCILLMLSCGLMFIPLWQNEQNRYDEFEDFVNITMILPNWEHYEIEVPKDQAIAYIEMMDDHRERFMNGRDTTDNVDKEVQIRVDYSQSYYFNLDEMEDEMIQFIEDILLSYRENSHMWNPYDVMYDEKSEGIVIDGEVHSRESYLQAHQATFEPSLTAEFCEKLIVDYNVDTNIYNRQYPLSFSSMNYSQWMDYIHANTKKILNHEQWANATASFNIENATITSKYFGDILKHTDGKYSLDSPEYWNIKSVTEKQITGKATIFVYMLSDYENEEFALFEDTEIGLYLDFVLDNVNGDWKTTITGVYY